MYPVTPWPGDQPVTCISVLPRTCGGAAGGVGPGTTAPAEAACSRRAPTASHRKTGTRHRRRSKRPPNPTLLMLPQTYTRGGRGVQWRSTQFHVTGVQARISPPCLHTLTGVRRIPGRASAYPPRQPGRTDATWTHAAGRTSSWAGLRCHLPPAHRARRDLHPRLRVADRPSSTCAVPASGSTHGPPRRSPRWRSCSSRRLTSATWPGGRSQAYGLRRRSGRIRVVLLRRTASGSGR